MKDHLTSLAAAIAASVHTGPTAPAKWVRHLGLNFRFTGTEMAWVLIALIIAVIVVAVRAALGLRSN